MALLLWPPRIAFEMILVPSGFASPGGRDPLRAGDRSPDSKPDAAGYGAACGPVLRRNGVAGCDEAIARR